MSFCLIKKEKTNTNFTFRQVPVKGIFKEFLIFIFLFCNVQSNAQGPSSGCGGGGSNDGGIGGGGGPSGPGDGTNIYIPTLHATDPNEIQGPFGVTLKKWMAAKDKFGYIVRFENDPEFATGPAQKVLVTVPIDPKFDINSLRIGKFGFGNMFFDVPPNSPTYYHRLDLRDSLGLYVDVLAGIDVTGHQAIWVFESIDPATGIEPVNAALGFLPVRDTSINRFNDSIPNKGEGFVTYYIQPVSTAHTGDSVNAKGSILFDLNAPVVTNTEGNTIDAVAPVSSIYPSPQVSNNFIHLTWTGRDDSHGSGVKQYALYVSVNGRDFSMYKDKINDTSLLFQGTKGNSYCFYTLATYSVGNEEALKKYCGLSITLNDALPISWLYFTGRKQNKDVLLNWSTTSEINSRLFVVERSLDGTQFTTIASVPGHGNSNVTNNYVYTDTNATALNSPVLYYRIKQLDLDGRFTYSVIVSIKLTINSNEPIVTAFPNPFAGAITLKILNITSTTKTDEVLLYTLDGKLLYRKEIKNRGTATILLDDLPKLSEGVYMLKTSINGKLFTIKMVHE